ncbi:macrophage mannose receptor 1-like [Limulus polyphemus]|uniref:Macrophage mannose receptor 1-like n=1 Tax=Limulus polyphemus TaxID=6850 RepID=A0ABM1C5M7_LIMPO|nr:macrophage mannose receptor 1-like [Limulus polyphemus]
MDYVKLADLPSFGHIERGLQRWCMEISMSIITKNITFLSCLIILSGLCGIETQFGEWAVVSDQVGSMYYQVIGKKAKFQDASNYCESNGFKLVTLTDLEVHKALKTLLSSSSVEFGGLWVGLHDQQKERDFKFTDGKPAPYLSEIWLDGQPDNGGRHTDNCARIQHDYNLLADMDCNNNYFGICEAPQIEIPECPSGYELFNSMCYKIHDSPKQTFNDSQLYCKNAKGMLARIPDNQVWQYLYNELPKKDISYWIGMTDEAEEGVWRYVDGNKVPQSFFEADLWGPGQPDNYDNSQHCCDMDVNVQHKIKDVRCSETKGFICEIIPNVIKGCQSGGKAHNGVCYYVTNYKKPFLSSEQLCQTDYSGSLVPLVDTETMQIIINFADINGKSSEDLWVGLTDEETEGEWKFVNGSETKFNPELWMDIEPNDGNSGNEDCVIIDDQKQYKLQDTDCSSEHSFICEKLEVLTKKGK